MQTSLCLSVYSVVPYISRRGFRALFSVWLPHVESDGDSADDAHSAAMWHFLFVEAAVKHAQTATHAASARDGNYLVSFISGSFN